MDHTGGGPEERGAGAVVAVMVTLIVLIAGWITFLVVTMPDGPRPAWQADLERGIVHGSVSITRGKTVVSTDQETAGAWCEAEDESAPVAGDEVRLLDEQGRLLGRTQLEQGHFEIVSSSEAPIPGTFCRFQWTMTGVQLDGNDAVYVEGAFSDMQQRFRVDDMWLGLDTSDQ